MEEVELKARSEYRSVYSSDLGDNILEDFLIPSLLTAKLYKRITGDFSSAFLVAAARGLCPLFLENGKMQLITNGRFTEDDLKAFDEGMAVDRVIDQSIMRQMQSIGDMVDEFERDHINALIWLLKNNRLEIKVSLLKDGNGRPLQANNPLGVQHSKVGLIYTKAGDTIAFLGGLNESMRAYMGNAETLQASYSWRTHDGDVIAGLEAIFYKLWNNTSPKTFVVDLPEACKLKLISTYDVNAPPDLSKWSGKHSTTAQNQDSRRGVMALWEHQKRAIQAFNSVGHGIIEMATGTGKTVTALTIEKEMLEDGRIESSVVVTKWKDLLDQWYEKTIEFFPGSEMLLFRHYGEYHDMDSFLTTFGQRNSTLLTTYENLSYLIEKDRGRFLGRVLLVCDEVHNIGSEKNVERLKGKLQVFRWRLGLSATPERLYDEEGTSFISNEIGEVVFKFDLTDAIRAGVLCEFDYVPLFYELNSEDKRRMRDAYAQFSARKKSGKPMRIEELYQELARVRKLSKTKLPVFRKYLETNPSILNRCLVFVETKEYGHFVQNIIQPLKPDYHTYYTDDDEINLQTFKSGLLNCLVTCRRISEGIDIKSINHIVLFSTAKSPLETIQRIGRALRFNSSDKSKRAVVVDFVRQSDLNEGTTRKEPTDAARFNWLSNLSKVKRIGQMRGSE